MSSAGVDLSTNGYWQDPALTKPLSIVEGQYSTAIGCGVTVAGSYEVGFGLGKTMAILHLDGAWSIDWDEVSRVAALSPYSERQCASEIVVTFARVLQGARGKVKEQ